MPNGLTIAFLEGVYNSEHFEQDTSEGRCYTKHDVESLKQTVESRGGDVDFFLSCEWPKDITKKLPEGSTQGSIALSF